MSKIKVPSEAVDVASLFLIGDRLYLHPAITVFSYLLSAYCCVLEAGCCDNRGQRIGVIKKSLPLALEREVVTGLSYNTSL
jgi:hypothetical protein